MTRTYYNKDYKNRNMAQDRSREEHVRPPQVQVYGQNQSQRANGSNNRPPQSNGFLGKKAKARKMFSKAPRDFRCLLSPGEFYLPVCKLDVTEIKNHLAKQSATMEHQFINLRTKTQLTLKDLNQRLKFTKLFLSCLAKHHGAFYEGILFGSSVNGLGFRDSDVDLRLRRLTQVGDEMYEPVSLDSEMVEGTLRDIAFQTRLCCPGKGEFVPSVRCPVAKLKLSYFGKGPNDRKERLCEGLNFDVSLSSKNSLGSFNSMFLKFLCDLQPKFHLLATVIRFWSKCQKLIQPGDLSSYALINMLIFFCQTTQPPLLPTVDEMRRIYLDQQDKLGNPGRSQNQAMTQQEWHSVICMDKDQYPACKNHSLLSILLLKFFEFYLTFPFKTHVITIRPGRALDHKEFISSNQYHPKFPLKTFVNIQDPFDLKHNLTSGLEGNHFKLLMVTMRHSYEKLYNELMNNFYRPADINPNYNRVNRPLDSSINGEAGQLGNSESNPNQESSKGQKESQTQQQRDKRDWGLNVLFNKLTEQELKDS